MKDLGLILGPYKEPLKKIKDGHGYYGALSFTTKGAIQCHICGDVFDNMGFHVEPAHDITVKEYRRKFGISMNSKLVSEAWRESRKNYMLEYLSNLTSEQRYERTERFIRAARKRAASVKGKKMSRGTNISDETINVRGICPDQLIAVINDAKEHFGYTPSKREFCEYHKTQRFIPPIVRTFGSWKKGLKAAGLHPKKREQGNHIRYTDDQLLEFLTVFYEEHGTIPTTSDIGRGFLPSWGVYIKHFGSMANARREAGIPEWSREHWKKTQVEKGLVLLKK